MSENNDRLGLGQATPMPELMKGPIGPMNACSYKPGTAQESCKDPTPERYVTCTDASCVHIVRPTAAAREEALRLLMRLQPPSPLFKQGPAV